MKTISLLSIALITTAMLFLIGCKKDEVFTESQYYNQLSFPDSSSSHSKHARYTEVLNQAVNQGLVGVSAMIRDAEGTWLGAGGNADIASNVTMEVGHQLFIGSVSKVFTATSVFAYIDDGLLSLEDPISKWLAPEIIEKVDNADEAQIKHLLSHTSGIKDWYTLALEMSRYNRESNGWDQLEILEYVYGKKAEFELGAQYGYSNTNYVLLGLILESVSGTTLKSVYTEKIFGPLNLKSAYYGVREEAVPTSVVKGYMDLYGTRGFVESKMLYGDEMSTGDGGIAINAQDLGVFMDQLLTGNLISASSLVAMQNWFEFDPGGTHSSNGYGLEYFEHELGVAYGHTGGVDGFNSFAWRYPTQDITIVVVYNFIPGTKKDYDLANKLSSDLEAIAFE